MAFSLLLLLLCFAAGVRISEATPPLSAPSPSPDCSTEVFDNLIDCLSFVQDGSTVAKPAAQCCSGLRKVVEEAPACLCSLSSQGQGQAQSFGVNVTKARTLPSACGVSASNCDYSGAPAAAAAAPGQSPSCGAPSSVSGLEFLSGFAVALWLYYQNH